MAVVVFVELARMGGALEADHAQGGPVTKPGLKRNLQQRRKDPHT